jgi:uncharacterized membrane protein
MTSNRYTIGLSRAFSGAMILGIPLLMTIEMWSLGFSMGCSRLLLTMLIFAVLVGLSYVSGFEKAFRMNEQVMDTFAAFGVGVITCALLLVLAVFTLDMTCATSPAGWRCRACRLCRRTLSHAGRLPFHGLQHDSDEGEVLIAF